MLGLVFEGEDRYRVRDCDAARYFEATAYPIIAAESRY